MNIIIVGCGNVGTTIAEQLCSEGHDITCIDEDSMKLQSIVNSFDVKGVVGNGASSTTMIDAGIQHADLMIAVTEQDEVNMLCCLIAKKAGNCHTIARVRNPIYKREIDFIKEELGLSMVINPEEAAANEAAKVLKFPSATRIDTFAKGKAELVKITLDDESRLCGKSLKEIQATLKSNVLIASVTRGDDVFIPNGDSVLQSHDQIAVVGATRAILSFFRSLKLPTARVHNTLIVGGGATAFYLSRQLITFGIDVKIIEKDTERCHVLSEALPDATIINADGTDKGVLMEEGLETAQSFVALTNLDEENIMLSLYAGSMAPKTKLITKVHRVNYSEIIGSLNIGSIIYPKNITAERIVQYVRGIQNSMGSNIESLYKLDDGKVEALEFIIGENSPVIDVPLAEMKIKKGILIACINHDGNIISPSGQTIIHPGDSVIIITTRTGLNDIKDILGKD